MTDQSLFRVPEENPTVPTSSPQDGRRGFTLIELLAVVAVVGIVMVVTLPAANSVLEAGRVASSAQMLTGGLSLARQTAFTRNRPSVLRLYRYDANDGAGTVYRAFQVFSEQGSEGLVPVQRAKTLAQGTLIDSGTLSSALSASGRQDRSPGAGDSKLPGVSSYVYQDIVFYPDGRVPLAADFPSLTLHSAKDGDRVARPPANFVTIVLDTLNGTVRTYRP